MRNKWLEGINYPRLRQQRALLWAVRGEFADKNMEREEEAIDELRRMLGDLVEYAASRIGKVTVHGAPSKNENCLDGIKCPKCGYEDKFLIEMSSAIPLTDEGTDFHGDTTWGEMSYIECFGCSHSGRVWEFQA